MAATEAQLREPVLIVEGEKVFREVIKFVMPLRIMALLFFHFLVTFDKLKGHLVHCVHHVLLDEFVEYILHVDLNDCKSLFRDLI